MITWIKSCHGQTLLTVLVLVTQLLSIMHRVWYQDLIWENDMCCHMVLNERIAVSHCIFTRLLTIALWYELGSCCSSWNLCLKLLIIYQCLKLLIVYCTLNIGLAWYSLYRLDKVELTWMQVLWKWNFVLQI